MTIHTRFALQIRKELGITQKELADYLGTNRTSIMYIEAGKRRPPAKVKKRLDRLETWSSSARPGAETLKNTTVQPEAKTLTAWERLKKRETHYLRNSERTLIDTEKRFEEARLCYARLESLPASTGTERRWVERVMRKHKGVMLDFGPAVQAELRMRIARYKAHIAVLDELLTNHRP